MKDAYVGVYSMHEFFKSRVKFVYVGQRHILGFVDEIE